MGKQDKETFAKLLVAIGGLLGIYVGITIMIGGASSLLGGSGMSLLYGLLMLVVSLAALMSAVKPGQPIPLNIVVAIVLGILMIILGGLWLGLIAGILVIIGGIFLAID